MPHWVVASPLHCPEPCLSCADTRLSAQKELTRDPRSNAPLSLERWIPYSGVRLCRSRAEHPSPPVKTNEAYMIMKSPTRSFKTTAAPRPPTA